MALTQRDVFVNAALSFVGQRYSIAPGRCDPHSTHKDCSGAVCAAATVAGYPLPCTTSFEIAVLGHRYRTGIPIQTAIYTRGALLIHGPNEGQGPSSYPDGRDGHVVISLGDGRLVEARGRAYGVLVDAYRPEFNYAMKLPGMTGFDTPPAMNPSPTTPEEARAMGLTAAAYVPGAHQQTKPPWGTAAGGRYPFVGAILNANGTTDLVGFNGALLRGGVTAFGESIVHLGHLNQPIVTMQAISRNEIVGFAADGGSFAVIVAGVHYL